MKQHGSAARAQDCSPGLFNLLNIVVDIEVIAYSHFNIY